MRTEQKWRARIAPTGKWFDAAVPGNVQYDWAASHGMEEKFMMGTGVRMFDAVEDVTWEYRTELQYEVKEGERVFLVFEGIDYYSEVWLGTDLLCRHEGMYTPIRLDVTEKAHPGDMLTVVIYPHPKSREARNHLQADQCCKAPSVYGWDWNPRLMISGLWRDAYVETRGKGYIRSCEPFYTLSEDRTSAEVRFETDCDLPVSYRVTDPDGAVVYEGTEPAFTLGQPRLWWCSGQGEQALYTWEAVSADHAVRGKIGFRTIRLLRNPGAGEGDLFPKPRYPAPMTVELNGRCIFCKGSNWVNPELFYGRTTYERCYELLSAARDANMNTLRIWGGSGINKPFFYDLCDEMGILVWQEFMLACADYVGTDEYLRILEQEATEIIVTLRRHPSLLLWCGGNELFNCWSGMTDQSLALRLLNKLTYDLDRSHPFLPTSPIEGVMHGCYLFDTGSEQVYQMFQRTRGTAYCEFGVPSIAPVENLRKIIPENELFPVEKTESWVIHHAFKAWGEEKWLCPDVLEKYFGKPHSIDEMVDQSSWLQSEGYKAIFEEARRQAPHCSMALNWCFDEPWITAANNSLLSYPALKKPAWYAVRDALRPTLASARLPKFDWKAGEEFTCEVWLLNDAPKTASAHVTASLVLGETVLPLGEWDSGECAANRQLGAVKVSLPKETCEEMTLRLDGEGGISSAYRLLYSEN